MNIKRMVADLGGEKVLIVRKNGDRYEDVSAVVSEDRAFFDAGDGVVDLGDEIHRETPTGVVVYIVEDPGYFAKSSMSSAHFQSKTRRSNKPVPSQPTMIENVHLHDNARINVNSTDNSTNTVQKDNVYNDLREKLSDEITDVAVKKQALAIVNELEAAKNETEFSESTGKMMNLGVQVATIFGPFVPLLAPLIGG